MKVPKQIVVNRQGQTLIQEFPAPELTPTSVLVETKSSLISPGTELHNIEGFMAEPEDGKVMTQGYSAAGVVVKVGDKVKNISVGDHVGCYGAPYTQHRTLLSVPETLFAKCPDNVSFEEAAFCGLGAITMNAVRQGKVTLGDNVVVVGLGPIGQMTSQMARAAGGHVIAMDLSQTRLQEAVTLGAEVGIQAGQKDSIDQVIAATDGVGADVVLICASGKYPKFLDEALQMVRKHGRVVVVGLFPIEIPRPIFFQKEADVTISRAAGPGRYNEGYEAGAQDYPIHYVRWTEGRNVQEVLKLISLHRIDVKSLITHRFPLDQAAEAYKTLAEAPEKAMGVVFQY